MLGTSEHSNPNGLFRVEAYYRELTQRLYNVLPILLRGPPTLNVEAVGSSTDVKNDVFSSRGIA